MKKLSVSIAMLCTLIMSAPSFASVRLLKPTTQDQAKPDDMKDDMKHDEMKKDGMKKDKMKKDDKPHS